MSDIFSPIKTGLKILEGFLEEMIEIKKNFFLTGLDSKGGTSLKPGTTVDMRGVEIVGKLRSGVIGGRQR